MSKRRQLLKLGILVLSALLYQGCVNSIKMYPIQQTDIFFGDNGTICMSERYFNEVLQAKIEQFK